MYNIYICKNVFTCIMYPLHTKAYLRGGGVLLAQALLLPDFHTEEDFQEKEKEYISIGKNEFEGNILLFVTSTSINTVPC